MKEYKRKMSKEELRKLLELRRSSASSKHRNRKKYYRPAEKKGYHHV
jgi:hypothetical protein